MTDMSTNPTASLVGYLCQTTPEQAVKAAMELCEQLPGDPESFHGGVWPGNVTLDDDGKAVLGLPMQTPAAQRPANQVEYLAPEFFWDGQGSAAADVFSVGLMIYAGCNKGILPFQPDKADISNQERASALRRRMKGEAIPAPEGVSADLKKVLEKALAYKPEDRYITAKELLFALHWTDEALGPDGDKAAAAPVSEGEPAPEAAEAETAEPSAAPVEDAAPIEEPPEPEESTEDMLREADAVLAAAAAAAAAVAGGAAVAGTAAHEGEASVESGDTEVDALAPSDGGASAQDEAGLDFVKDASGDNTASTTEAAAAAPAAKKEYKVQKDFERSPDRKAPTVAPVKKRSKAIPVLCGVAAAALLGGAGYMVFGNSSNPTPSETFEPASTEQVSMEAPSPVVITPEPTGTAKPTKEPKASPEASPKASAKPGEGENDDDGVVIVTPAPGSLTASASGGAGGTAAGPNGTGTTGQGGASGTTPGGSTTTPGSTGSSGGTGSGGGTSQGGNTGSGGGTSWGGNTGSGGGSSWGGNTGSGGGTSWGGGTGSGGGSSWGGGTSTTPAPTYTVSPADDTVYITGVGVNVRSGPGTSYPIIGSASTGYELKRTGTAGEWSRVSFKGTTGFVSNTYLSTTNPTPSATAAPQQTPGTEATPQPAPRYTVTSGDLTYDQAKSQAQSAGGLTVIKSDDDFEAVVRQLNNGGSGVDYAWLGVAYDSAADCWRWDDGSVLYTGDSHWASGSPEPGDDLVLLAKQDGSWKYVSLSSADFDLTAYAGKLGYVTGS